jgi:hypothetical protein
VLVGGRREETINTLIVWWGSYWKFDSSYTTNTDVFIVCGDGRWMKLADIV